jgi:hypothetical protein
MFVAASEIPSSSCVEIITSGRPRPLAALGARGARIIRFQGAGYADEGEDPPHLYRLASKDVAHKFPLSEFMMVY